MYGHLVNILKVPVHSGKSSSEQLPPVILLKKQPKRLDHLEIKARKTSGDKSGEYQDEKSIGSKNSTLSKPMPTDNKPKALQTEKSIHQQPQLSNKVAQAISAVKAKVIAPKEKSKQDLSANPVKKNSIQSNVSPATSEAKYPEEKSKQGTLSKKHVLNSSTSSTSADVKSHEVKQSVGENNTKQSRAPEIGSLAASKSVNLQVNDQPPLQTSNYSNRLVAEVKPMQSTPNAPNIKKSHVEAQPVKHDINDDDLKNESVKKAAERFEKETIKANNMERSGRGFGAYRERSKSIGNSLASKVATDIEDVDYEEDSLTASSSSMLPWANRNNMGKSSTPAVVRKRNSARGMGAYQLQMSKSSDSITAAKLLAEARMKGNARYQEEEGVSNQLRGHQNYHQQKTLRINAQNYGGVGGRGEMSKSIEKQIDVYTKTREDIRRILNAAKKLSVAERVKLLDNQQIEPDQTSSLEADEDCEEIKGGTQVSGVVKSRYGFCYFSGNTKRT